MGVAVPLVLLLVVVLLLVLLLKDEPLGRPADSVALLAAGLLALWTSLLENMRVNRSLTDVFSAVGGFSVESPLCAGVVWPFCPAEPASEVRAGDLVPPSWDFSEEGFELGVEAGRFASLNVVVGIVVVEGVKGFLPNSLRVSEEAPSGEEEEEDLGGGKLEDDADQCQSCGKAIYLAGEEGGQAVPAKDVETGRRLAKKEKEKN
jgi:hypothetical protein